MATFMGLLGMAVGFVTGRASQAAHRAHSDWMKTKASVPLLYRTFLSLLGSAAGWILIVGVAAVVLIAWTRNACPLAGSATSARIPQGNHKV